jgi:probable rRNA maturation factor
VLSLAVVDDPTIHQLNLQYRKHDGPTDVLSFALESDDDHLEGEVIVSADRAATCAPRFGWSVEDELTLYVTHGVLHLVGYDDQSPEDRARMTARECYHLARLGLDPLCRGPAECPPGGADVRVPQRLQGESGR